MTTVIDCRDLGLDNRGVMAAAMAAAPGAALSCTEGVIECDDGLGLTHAAIAAAAASAAAAAPRRAVREQLTRSDAAFIRVIEDVIGALIAKGIIEPADLPAAARAKLADRAALRVRLVE